MPQDKFIVGQIVHHLKFDYRGVIVEVHAQFQGTDEWYEQVAKSRPPKDQPWYRVLVNQSDHETYVAARHLEIDATARPIIHPLISLYFDDVVDGVYVTNRAWN